MGGAVLGRTRRACVAVLVAGVVAACALALCACFRNGAPATTEELLVRYVALPDVDDFKADASVDLGVSGTGFRARVPIAAHFESADKVAHGTITADLSSLDVDDYTVEVYAELLDRQLMCYLRSGADAPSSWRRWAVDLTKPIDIFTLTNLLAASELSIVAKDSDEQARYELSVPTKTALETAFEIMSDPPDLDMADFEDDHVNFDFTQDCHLRSAFTRAMFALTLEETGTDVNVSLDAVVKLDGYGTVEAADVAIPDEVRQTAVQVDDPIEISDVVGGDGALAKALAGEGEVA